MLDFNITSAKDALNTISLLSEVCKKEIRSFIANNIISDGFFRDGTTLNSLVFLRCCIR